MAEDGKIKIEIDIELDAVTAKLETMKRQIENSSETAKQKAEAMAVALAEASDSLANKVSEQNKELDKLQDKFDKTSREAANAFSAGKDDEYRELEKQKQELQKEIIERKKTIEEFERVGEEIGELLNKADKKIAEETKNEADAEIKAAKQRLVEMEQQAKESSIKSSIESSELRAEATKNEKLSAEQRNELIQKAIEIDKKNLDTQKKLAEERLKFLEEVAKKEGGTSEKTNAQIAKARQEALKAEKAYNDGIKKLEQESQKSDKSVKLADEKQVKGDVKVLNEAFNSIGGPIGEIGKKFIQFATDGSGSFKKVGTAVKAFGKVLLTSPIGWIAGVIAVVVVLFNKLANAVKSNTNASSAWSKIMAAFQPVINMITKAFNMLAEALVPIFNWFADKLPYAITGLVRIYTAAYGTIIKGAGYIVKVWTTAFGAILDGITAVIKGLNKIPGINIDTKGLEDFKEKVTSIDEKIIAFGDSVIQKGKDIQDNYKNQAEECQKLIDAEKALAAQRRKSMVEEAKNKQEIAKLRDQIAEEKDASKRMELLKKVQSLEEANMKKKRDIAREELRLFEEKKTQFLSEGHSEAEYADEKAKLETALINTETEYYNHRRRLSSQLKSATQQDKKAREEELKRQIELARGWGDLAQDADTNARKNEIEAMKEQLNISTSMTEKLKLQADIRERELQLEQDLLFIERQRALEDIDNDSNLKDDEKAQRKALKNAEYDQKEEQLVSKSAKDATAEDMTIKVEAYKAYAEKVLEIEEWKNEKLKAIDENDTISKEEKATQKAQVEQSAEFNQEMAMSDILGENAEAMATDLQQMISGIMDLSLAEAQDKLKVLKAEVERLKKEGADPNKIAKAEMALDVATKKVTQSQSKLGSTAKEKNKDFENSVKGAAKALSAVQDACDVVQDAFGELMSEGGNDALNTIKVITTTALGLMSTVTAVSETSSSAIKACETASVILAVISAVITVITAIINVFAKYFSENARLQQQIDESKERVKDLQKQYDEMERSVKRAVGTDYYQGQIELCKNLTQQQKELNKQLQDTQRQIENANTESKKDKYREQYDEINKELNDNKDEILDKMDEFYNDLIGTDLKGFSESLADSIVEGFSSGIDDLDNVWDNAFDDMMKNMLKKQIAMTLEQNLAGVFNNIRSAFGDGDQELTEAEIARIKEQYETAQAVSEAQLQEYQKLMESLGLTDDPEQQAEQKGFAAMSQDTGDELNGRFTAIQISTANIDMNTEDLKRINTALLAATQEALYNVSVVVGVAENQLISLREIANNTSALKETNLRLKKIEDNTAKL